MHTAGVLFFLGPHVRPFLTVDQRVDYLYERGYFEPGSVTEEHAERLSRLGPGRRKFFGLQCCTAWLTVLH